MRAQNSCERFKFLLLSWSLIRFSWRTCHDLVVRSYLSSHKKICYDNTGNAPYKGRNFNTKAFGRMYFFVICMISRHWFALSKPPQRRQGPDPRPLWLLVGTPSAFGPELAYRLRVAQPTLMDVTRYFWYTFILLYMFVYYIFMTSPLWLAVGPQST